MKTHNLEEAQIKIAEEIGRAKALADPGEKIITERRRFSSINPITEEPKFLTDFDKWWYEIGSSLKIRTYEDMEEFAKRVSLSAWNFAKSESQK